MKIQSKYYTTPIILISLALLIYNYFNSNNTAIYITSICVILSQIAIIISRYKREKR
jgi:hypothetical protein